MAKSKYVDVLDEKEFIRLDTEIKERNNLLAALKTKFGKLFDRGFKFKLLTPKPSVGRVTIDWEQEARDLAAKYVVSPKRWEKEVLKKYKPTSVATSFIVPKKEGK